MTVEELIKKLEEYPKDMEVYIHSSGFGEVKVSELFYTHIGFYEDLKVVGLMIR